MLTAMRLLLLALVLALGGCVTIDRRQVLQLPTADPEPASTTTTSPELTCWPTTTVIKQCLRRL